MKDSQNGFKSIYGFIMTAIGFAVGVGSIWKFPYVVGKNGGCLFLLLFIVLVLIVGVPLLTAEISIGYKTQKTPILAYKMLAPGKKWHLGGYLHIITATLLIGYITPIYAWILKYITFTPFDGFKNMSSIEITEFFTNFSTDSVQISLFGLINFIFIILVIRKGLQGGVEKINKILLPCFTVIMVVIIIYCLFQPGSEKGIQFLLNPESENFTINSFIQCLGIMFFSLGIAMLASMVFGSYIKIPKTNIMSKSIIISLALTIAGILASFMVMLLVFSNDLEPTYGPGLAFVTIPNVFSNLDYGNILGTVFYVGFYFAAFTSTIGVVEALVAVYMEHFNINRSRAITYALTPCIIISILVIWIPGINLFDIFDQVVNNYLLIIGGLWISIFCGWIWKADNCLDAANVHNKLVRTAMKISIKYISPVIIAIIFINHFEHII